MSNQDAKIILFTSSDATSTASGHLPYPLELTRNETGTSSNYGSQPHNLDSQDLMSGYSVDYNVSSPGLFITEDTLVQISKGDRSYIIRSRELNQANLESLLDNRWEVTGYQEDASEEQISSLLNIPDLGIQLVFAITEEEPVFSPPRKDRDDDDHDHPDMAGGSRDLQYCYYLNPTRAGPSNEPADSSTQSTTYITEGNSYHFNLLPIFFVGSLSSLSYNKFNNVYEGAKVIAGMVITYELLADHLL